MSEELQKVTDGRTDTHTHTQTELLPELLSELKMGVNWTPVDMVTFVTLDMDSWSYKCDHVNILGRL